MNNQPEIDGLTAIRLPQETLKFIQNNPKVAEVTGMALSQILDMKSNYEEAVAMWKNPDTFEGLIESGTKEELAVFLNAVHQAVHVEGSFITVPVEGEEGAKAVVEELKEVYGASQVVATDIRGGDRI